MSAPQPSTIDPLTRALDLVARDEIGSALTEALAAWEISPCPALARAIRKLSERTALPVSDTLRGRTPSACERWLDAARAADASQIPALLETLFKASPADALPRLRSIASRADPRIDLWCLETVESLPYIPPYTRKYLREHLERLALICDATLLERIEALPGRWIREIELSTARWLSDLLRAALPQIRDRLARAREDLPLALALEERSRSSRVRGVDLDELLSMVYESPEEDEPRLVYADALMQRGDLRGEFIALQILGKDAPSKRRAKHLASSCGRQWLGPLARAVASGFVFERGFLARCKTDRRSSPLLASLAGHPAWSTVTHFSGASSIGLHPGMRALRHLGVDFAAERSQGEPWVDLLDRTERPLQSLSYTLSEASAAEELEMLAHCRALPQLKELEIVLLGVELADLMLHPVLSRLDRLALALHNALGLASAPVLLRGAPAPEIAFEIGRSRIVASDPGRERRYTDIDAYLHDIPSLEALGDLLEELPSLERVSLKWKADLAGPASELLSQISRRGLSIQEKGR